MKTKSRQATSVKRRISRFYQLLGNSEFEECYRMIDPRILDDSTSITLYQYIASAKQFLNHFGRPIIDRTEIEVHEDENSARFANRDFALGKTYWEDQSGVEHIFLERWVREGRRWYTLSTGFLVPRN